MKRIAPKCPIHLGREMKRVGEILKAGFQGQREILGYRFRCPISKCPACEVVLLPPPEIVLTKFGRRRRVTY
jgi:hypothetical protein